MQTHHSGIFNPQRFGQCFVDLGQVRRLDFLQRHHEICSLACHILAMVVSRERQRESFALASFHATRGFFKFLEHLTVAKNELEVLRLAALESLAINLAFKINSHAVTVFCGGILRALGKRAALFAQDVNRLGDRRF